MKLRCKQNIHHATNNKNKNKKKNRKKQKQKTKEETNEKCFYLIAFKAKVKADVSTHLH